MQKIDEVKEQSRDVHENGEKLVNTVAVMENKGSKRLIAKVMSLVLFFIAAYAFVVIVQWGIADLALPQPYIIGPNGEKICVYFPLRYHFLCAAENCVSYAAWAFVLAWLFKGFQEKIFSVTGRTPMCIIANFMIASIFCLQLLITESVADAACFSRWIGFLGSHLTGCTCLLLLALFLAVIGGKERRLVCYAFTAFLAYVFMLTAASLLKISFAVFRGGMIAFIFVVFAIFVMVDMFSGKTQQIQSEEGFTHTQKIVRAVVYVLACVSYVIGIMFWRGIGREDALILEERFLQDSAPLSVKALRTKIFTERDAMRSRFNNMNVAFSNSFVDAGMELMAHPEKYGADPVITNMLLVLARDESGNVVRGLDTLNNIVEPDEGNGEFGKNLQDRGGMLSDILLESEIVDRVTKNAMTRLQKHGDLALSRNIFLVHTRDKRMISCRVGRDTYYKIKVLYDANGSNTIFDGTSYKYGNADLKLSEILAFSTFGRPDVLINETICMSAIFHTIRRLNLPLEWRDYTEQDEHLFRMLTDPEKAKDNVEHFAESALNEDEVDEIRHAFIEAVNSKNGLSLTGWAWIRDKMSSLLMIISYCGLFFNRKRVMEFAKNINPKTTHGRVGLLLLIGVLALVTFQLITYVKLWKEKKEGERREGQTPLEE